MKPLRKPFSASETTIEINIGGKPYTFANLLKSAILNQTTVLMAVGDTWQQIDVLKLGADNSNLEKFKETVELHDFKLKDFGIAEPESHTDYSLKHDDFMSLSQTYPFNYIEIEKLYKWELKEFKRSGVYSLNQTLKAIANSMTIDEYIAKVDADKNKIINSNTNKMADTAKPDDSAGNEREKQLLKLGMKWDLENDSFVGHELIITPSEIDSLDAEAWEMKLKEVQYAKAGLLKAPESEAAEAESATPEPAAEQPAAEQPAEATHATEQPAPVKLMKMEVIGGLKPERIAELVELPAKTDALLKENPVIEIKTKKDRDAIQKSIGAVLSACTELDGEKNGMKVLKNKYLKTLSQSLDVPIDAEAARRRAHLEALRVPAKIWDDAELKRKAAEDAAKKKKIDDRVQSLFDAGMVFAAGSYSIGTFYIMPSQIETMKDEEFAAELLKAQNVAKELAVEKEAEIEADNVKDAAIRLAAQEIAKFTNEPIEQVIARLTGVPAEEPAPAAATAQSASPVNSPPQQTAPAQAASAPQSAAPSTAKPAVVYQMPHPDNRAMNEFDMQFVQIIGTTPIPDGFLKCRTYFDTALKYMGTRIQEILNDQSGAKKPDLMNALIAEVNLPYADSVSN